jgi:predicted phosphoribosyltransferase
MKIEELKANVIVQGPIFPEPVQIIVAVPTGPSHTVQQIAGCVTRLYCANIRSSMSFAVAAAYSHWPDVTEEEALRLFKQLSIKKFPPEGT